MRIKYDTVTVCDAFVCESVRFHDERGFFEELYSQKDMPQFKCLQLNCSRSKEDVLRGLHIVPFAKLVRCVKGRIFDVVADVRKESKTYLKWYGIELSEQNQLSLYVPANCAHGFLALEENSFVIYAQDGIYDPKLESSVHFADPTLAIKWPIHKLREKVSEKDGYAPFIIKDD